MAKRKKKTEEEKLDTFTPLFLALSVILLAFFILLNSLAELKTDKMKRALRSFRASRSGMGIYGPGIKLDETSLSPGGDTVKPVKTQLIYDAIERSITKWGEGQGLVDVYEDERKLTISLREKALFKVNSQTMHPRMFPFLNDIGKLVKRIKIPVTVQGHSDSSRPPPGRSNFDLSGRRASEIMHYLLEGVNVPVQYVEAEAFADNRPVANNRTAIGRSRNRRVDMVFYKRDISRLVFEEK